MPNPFISPTTIGVGPYTINNSKNALINLTLSAGLGDSAEFSVTYPSGPGVQVALVKGGISLNLLPSPAGQPFAGRTIAVSTTPSGGNTILTCDITVTSTASPGEAWAIQVSGLAGGLLNFSMAMFLAVTRLMCDPVAGFTITANTLSGSTVKEKDTVTLTSASALGPPATPTVVGAPAPVISYLWSYTGSIAITEFNAGCVASPNFIFLSPAVYADVPIALTLTVWYDSPCPNPGFLNNSTSPAQILSIQARTQFVMLVLDRTGSMWGPKWDNAGAAARMLAQLYVSLRKGVSPNDQVGIMAFEDNQCIWHLPPRDASMDPPVMPLNSPTAVENMICAVNLGNPGSCTPIGDALVQAMQDLQNAYNANPAANPSFTIILVTDGIENSGHVYVDSETYNQMTPSEKAVVQSFDSARTAFANVNATVSLYTIGVGTDTQVQAHVLDQLAIKGKARFRLVNDPTDIIDGIVQMVSFSRDAAKVSLYPGAPPQPDPNAGTIAQKRYFTLAPKAGRLAILLEWGTTDPTDSIELAYRAYDSGTSSFHGVFTPVAGATKLCPTHGFLGEDLALTLGSGSSENVPATEWRIVHRRTSAPGDHSVAIVDNKTMIIEDLYVKADIVFDRDQYRTGEPMVISAYLRAGDQPVTGARVMVELERPGEGMGTFFVNNAALVPNFITTVKVSSHAASAGAAATGGDPASLKLAYLNRLLAANNLTALPYLTPHSIFPDGSNELFDDGAHQDRRAGDGIYTNVYTSTDREGTYTWRFTITGTLPDGTPFSRVITLSKWVGVNVDLSASTVQVTYGVNAPAGYLAAQVFVTPVDVRGQYLGPFKMSDLQFQTSVGSFPGGMIMDANGRYSQIVQYRPNEVPVVTITVQGKTFMPVVVSKGCLGSILAFLRYLIEFVLSLFTKKGNP